MEQTSSECHFLATQNNQGHSKYLPAVFPPCLNSALNHHGKVVTNINADQYCLQLGVLSEYVLQVAGPPRPLIDASNEECPLHEWNVCLGRLANHATQRNNEANMKKVEVYFPA